jgi:hypothetical protein
MGQVMNSKQCPKCGACSTDDAASCRDCGFQWPAPISHADFVSEGNRNYDLGRKHKAGELESEIERLKANNHKLRVALVGLVGSDDAKELDGMEAMIRISQVPEEDRVNTINAINILRQTKP